MRFRSLGAKAIVRRIALLLLLLTAPLLVFGQGGAWNISLLRLAHLVAGEAESGSSVEESDADEEEAVSQARSSLERRRNAGKKPFRLRFELGMHASSRAGLAADFRLQPPLDSSPRPILYRHLIRRLN